MKNSYLSRLGQIVEEGDKPYNPYKKLAIAVFMQCLKDILFGDSAQQREGRWWLYTEGDPDRITSTWWAEQFDLDWLRSTIIDLIDNNKNAKLLIKGRGLW